VCLTLHSPHNNDNDDIGSSGHISIEHENMCLDCAITRTILNNIPELRYEALQGPDQENHKCLKITKLNNFI